MMTKITLTRRASRGGTLMPNNPTLDAMRLAVMNQKVQHKVKGGRMGAGLEVLKGVGNAIKGSGKPVISDKFNLINLDTRNIARDLGIEARIAKQRAVEAEGRRKEAAKSVQPTVGYRQSTPLNPDPLEGQRYVITPPKNIITPPMFDPQNHMGANMSVLDWDSLSRNVDVTGVSGHNDMPIFITTPGGRGYTFDKEHQEKGIGGASGKEITERIAKRINNSAKEGLEKGGTGEALALVQTMGEYGEDFSHPIPQFLFDLVNHRLMEGKITQKDADFITRLIQTRNPKVFQDTSGFAGFNDRGWEQFHTGEGLIGTSPGKLRTAISDVADMDVVQRMLDFNMADFRNAITDEKLKGVPKGYIGSAVIQAPEGGVKTSLNPLYPVESPYEANFTGKGIAEFPEMMNTDALFYRTLNPIKEELLARENLKPYDKQSLHNAALGAIAKRKENISQMVDPQLVDDYGTYLHELSKPNEYKDGGAVHMKDGNLVDELINEAKKKQQAPVDPLVSKRSSKPSFSQYLNNQKSIESMRSEVEANRRAADALTGADRIPEATIRSTEPAYKTPRERYITPNIEGSMTAAGMNPDLSRRETEQINSGVDFVPGAMFFEDARNVGDAVREGRYLDAYGNSLIGAANLLGAGAVAKKVLSPIAKPLANEAAYRIHQAMTKGEGSLAPFVTGIAPRQLITHHGSPHLFPPTKNNPLGEFDPTKIGTGEGAQAYGYGHYLAEARKTGEDYAKNLANRDMKNQGRLNAHANAQRLANLAGDPKYAADDIKFVLSNEQNHPQQKLLQDTLSFLESGDFAKPLEAKGNIYKVDLPDEHIAKMLDWDKPLSQQTPEVQKMLEAVPGAHPKQGIDNAVNAYQSAMDAWNSRSANPTAEELARLEKAVQDTYANWQSMRGLLNSTPASAYQRLGKTNAESSELLRQAGIPGIKYLDQGSRDAGEGTRNFVVFPGNEHMMNIVGREKDGGVVRMAGGGKVGALKALGEIFVGGAKVKVRPPSDNVANVRDANFQYPRTIGNQNVSIGDLKGGVRFDKQESQRVNQLAAKIASPEGYISRIIVDHNNNVIEGQHRLEALRKLGAKEVPVYKIEDLADTMPVAKMESAIESVGGIHPDHTHQLMKHVLDDIAEHGIEGARQMDAGAFQKYYDAALDAASRKAPQEDALRLAQQRAALPPAKGGLGLPAGNTAEQRAMAMGFNTDAYHATDADIIKFNSDKLGTNTSHNTGGNQEAVESAMLGHWFSDRDLTNKDPRGYVFGDVSYPVKLSKPKKINDKEFGSTSYIVKNPDNIRSRFAAFDPFRRNAAIAAAMGVAAPDLLAAEPEKKAKGGPVSLDAMRLALQNKKVQHKAGGGKMEALRAIGRGYKGMREPVKPKSITKEGGGNWLAGSVEGAMKPLKRGVDDQVTAVRNPATGAFEYLPATPDPMNQFIDKQLTRYVKNQMATKEDPIRALAEKGAIHTNIPIQPGGAWVEGRVPAGESDQAKNWDALVDQIPRQAPYREHIPFVDYAENEADDLRRLGGEFAVNNPEALAYQFNRGKSTRDLGFDHLIDELRNATNPASGLPRELLIKPESLSKLSVPQAVERVAKINEWRAAQKAEADVVRASNIATVMHKDYPDKGYSWKELRMPETPTGLPEGWKVEEKAGVLQARSPDGNLVLGESMPDLVQNIYLRHPDTPGSPKAALEDALKYEGEQMGHCVGGYCPDVASGSSRIFSLRDAKGQPHVTVETSPRDRGELSGDALNEMEPGLFDKYLSQRHEENGIENMHDWLRNARPELAKSERIVQIKGKGNKKPNEEYLPFVQDFVKSGKWSDVGDFHNTGLMRIAPESNEALYLQKQNKPIPEYVSDQEYEEIRRGMADVMRSPYGAADEMKRGGAVKSCDCSIDAMRLAVMSKQLRKHHG